MIPFMVEAADEEGDLLTYSALNLPEGAIFKTDIGLFFWQSKDATPGIYELEFVVTDGKCTVLRK